MTRTRTVDRLAPLDPALATGQLTTIDQITDAAETSFAGARVAHAPLTRYARWQARDFVKQRAGVLLVVAAIMVYPLLVTTWGDRVIPADDRETFRQFWLYAMVAAIVPIGTLLGTRGIVSEDRAQGYHRFLFAKPVNMVRYYAQQFGIQYAGIMSVVAIVSLLYCVLVTSVPLVPVFVASTAFFLLFGGVSFLYSTITRNEWLWTLLTVAATGAARALVEFGYDVMRPASWLLLPLESFGRMFDAFAKAQTTVGLGHAVIPILYGAAAFVGGLFVLRKRSLTA
jgi:hypothetical protein